MRMSSTIALAFSSSLPCFEVVEAVGDDVEDGADRDVGRLDGRAVGVAR